ncbi:tail fiber domain-containing protein [Spartinivicinus poritis]|uniref:Tail fiber domain-containing protein n=1 Tax=Spartinivicinus poritis TaxID=2994640 RepID=A0ABT5UCD6_9GAMM|nr:tail fiber domain-containing protein [Spartinivicinus sp. A2-2]MDE1463982.1 tail fiber domain-containing protein [Spartinivicinus sp. A2-2]
MKKLIGILVLGSISTLSHSYSHESCVLQTGATTGKAYWDCRANPNFMRFSDQSLKKNTVQVDKALEKVSKLKGKSFEWKSSEETGIENLPQGKDIGVIAQDVEKVFPELIQAIKVTDKSGTEVTLKKVNYAGLVGVLIEAVKELKQENKELREHLGL